MRPLYHAALPAAVVLVCSVWLASAQPGKRGTQYAILIAISSYGKTDQWRPLPYTIDEMREFRDVLLATGFAAENIEFLHDQQTQDRLRPTATNIFKKVRLMLDEIGPEDTLLLALNGHGVQYKADLVGYFCPVNADLLDKKTLVPMDGKDGLYALLESCKAKRKLLIVNACRNDPTRDLSFAAEKVHLVDRDESEVPRGIAALYSCKPGQRSYYYPEEKKIKRSMFYHHLIEAWRGKYAEGEKVTLEHVFEAVTRKTAADARTIFSEPQTPWPRRKYDGEWLLSAVPARSAGDPEPGAANANPDEGFWLFNQPPRQHWKEKYQFDPSAARLEHLQKSCVRFNAGGSGCFVSGDGLVMTNHHIGMAALQRLSARGKDYVQEGFYARTLEEEFRAEGEELQVLVGIEDVTSEVNNAVKPGMTPSEVAAARRAAIATIEADHERRFGLRSEVVPLYQGERHHVYRYKRYTDVRMVFAPEQQIAFFGGDPDNFVYPRHCLDVCFFRVYEDGQPARTPNYLKWNAAGPKEDQLVFVAGHPGQASRHYTVAELSYLRDVGYPFLLQRLERLDNVLTKFSNQGETQRRQAQDLLFSVTNSRKARIGALAELNEGKLMARRAAQEKSLRDAVARRADLKPYADAWDAIARTQERRAALIKRYTLLETAAGFNTALFGFARALVRAADEYARPDEDRLPEFIEARKGSVHAQLLSKQPLALEFERARLMNSLAWMGEVLGADDPIVRKVLAGKQIGQRVNELLDGSGLWDVAERKRLLEGGKAAIDASDDPMILLARLVDAESRKVRAAMAREVEEPKRLAYEQIARARFAVEGTDAYPEPNFTLRLSFGQCKGYVEKQAKVPFHTTFESLYRKASEQGQKPPYNLPPRWVQRKDRLKMQTPFNFVCTADIIGGNSGSPVVNRAGEIVGLIFDGNMQSLGWDFAYTDEQARAIAVATPAIAEAVRTIYQAGALADELIQGRR